MHEMDLLGEHKVIITNVLIYFNITYQWPTIILDKFLKWQHNLFELYMYFKNILYTEHIICIVHAMTIVKTDLSVGLYQCCYVKNKSD